MPSIDATEPTLPLWVGIDENGLGARLGPLVVTAVCATVDARGARLLSRRLPAAFDTLLGDSKALVAHGDVALGEAWARALVPTAQTPAELLEALCLEPAELRRAPCPSAAVANQCWASVDAPFVAKDAQLKAVARQLRWLAARGVTGVGARSLLICSKRLNTLRSAGISRFSADLHAMETLTLAFREQHGSELRAVCGKVGGMGAYGRFFGPLAGRLHVVMDEGAAQSGYRFPGLGELWFVRDADATAPLVMLASLVGKYVRELMMARIVAHHREHTPELPAVSGYHDPATSRFVAASALARRERAFPDGCFERERAG